MLRIALLQVKCGSHDKAANYEIVEKAISAAVDKRANFVVLPEMWSSPYEVSKFAEFAETVSLKTSPTFEKLSSWARMFKITLVGGSIAERDEEGRLFNTSLTFNSLGELICKHRKVHLFDIDVPNGIRFKESDVLSAGSKIVSTFDVPSFGRVGVAICYDIRFSSAIELLANDCKLLVVPAAFNLTTGPLHWTLLGRARALDSQCFVAMCAPARDMDASYKSYGHSLLVSPWGRVIEELDEQPGILIHDLEETEFAVRDQIPVLKQKRHDLYQLIEKKQ